MTKVLLKTNHGDITLSLDAVKAPKSVANFLQYVKSGHYDGTGNIGKAFCKIMLGFGCKVSAFDIIAIYIN